MVQPLVKEFLRNKTFRELEELHGVGARLSNDRRKASLNYDQITAKSGDRLSEECRGMVVRVSDDITSAGDSWKDVVVGDVKVLAWPMTRFYNYGDPAAAAIDWSDRNLRVYEKLDGTMIALYWDDEQEMWHAATRSVPEADLPITSTMLTEDESVTFSQLFMRALVETREERSGKKVDWDVEDYGSVVHLNKENTYVFELTSPYNRIVVKYDVPRVTLLAVRHTATGREICIEDVNMPHANRPKCWKLNDLDALVKFVDGADPLQLEGAVVVDSKFRRLKVKNKSYMMSSRIKENVMSSRRNALECIIAGRFDDVLPTLDGKAKEILEELLSSFARYCIETDKKFIKFRDEAGGSRKLFAELVNLTGDWVTPYFMLYDKKAECTVGLFQTMYDGGRMTSGALDNILEQLKKVSTVSK